MKKEIKPGDLGQSESRGRKEEEQAKGGGQREGGRRKREDWVAQVRQVLECRRRFYQVLRVGGAGQQGVLGLGLPVWTSSMQTTGSGLCVGVLQTHPGLGTDGLGPAGLDPGLQIYSGGQLQHFIDGYDVQKSNWMRYVNPAGSPAQQNLVACQTGPDIYFYTLRPLEPRQELLVWYSQEFAQRLCSQPEQLRPEQLRHSESPPPPVWGPPLPRCEWLGACGWTCGWRGAGQEPFSSGRWHNDSSSPL
ncbi:unnamed protein product [Menidia menidia]|uniref:(Atlantic silverside) hypothetical protein n=1 Tax=Menidia menidia TaxID=238744 RepID=A0A8S4AU48_9TELE|nr:unnamed protein product [Menidia menidia]